MRLTSRSPHGVTLGRFVVDGVEVGSVRGTRTFLSWIVTSALTIGLGLAAAGLVRASAPSPPASATRTTPAPAGASAPAATPRVASPVPYIVGYDDGSDWSGTAAHTPGASSLASGSGSGDGSGDH